MVEGDAGPEFQNREVGVGEVVGDWKWSIKSHCWLEKKGASW